MPVTTLGGNIAFARSLRIFSAMYCSKYFFRGEPIGL